MLTPRFPGRRILAASACAATILVAAPVAAPFGAPSQFPSASVSAAAVTDVRAAGDDDSDDPAMPEPTTAYGREIQGRMDEVTARIDEDGGTIGMAFMDRQTGEIVCNENCLEPFRLASLSKVFIAEVVGYTNYTPPRRGRYEAGDGDMPVEGNQDAMLRDDMIRLSDNEATNALWARYGRTEIIENVAERYGLSDATIPNGDWGSWSTSPLDMVNFFDGMLEGEGGMSEVETDYLVQLMYSLPRYSYGNSDQNIGLRAALPDERIATKAGWYDPRIRTSAGFFGEDDRYAIAVFASRVSPDDFTEAIADVFPEGHVLRDGEDEDGNATYAFAGAAEGGGGAVGSASLPWIGGILLAAGAGFFMGWALRRPGGRA